MSSKRRWEQRYQLMIIAGVVIIATVVGVTFSRQSARGSIERIVYSTEDTGHLATIEPDGSGIEKVRTGHYSDQGPLWSPDRQMIAFTSGEGDSELWVSNPDGSDASLISPSERGRGEPWINGFDWAPDSSRIVYARNLNLHPQDQRSLVVHNVRSGEDEVLMEGEAAGEFPVWSPDGRRIAFFSTLDGGNDLFTIAPDGSRRKQVTRLPRWSRATDPRWSPDGTRICYERTSRARYDHDLVVVDVGSGRKKVIAGFQDAEYNCDWSSNGRYIAYVLSRTEGLSALAVVDVMNGDRVSFLESGQGIYFTWSPDGSRLAAAVGGYTIGARLVVIDVATGDKTDLGRIADGGHIDW